MLGYSHHELGPVAFTPTPVAVASMPLPKGKYLVEAKVVVEVASGPADVTCELTGAAEDVAKAEQLRSDADGVETLPLVSSGVLERAGMLGVSCRVNGGTAYATEIRLSALR